MRVFVYTNKGWVLEDEVFTSSTKNIKKKATATPIEVNDELTLKFITELPMVLIKRGYYYIQCI